jgi:hypothetical protein
MTDVRDLISRMSEANAIMVMEGLPYLTTLLEWKKDSYNLYKKAFPEFQFQVCQNSNHQVIGMLLDSHEQQQKLMMDGRVEFKAYYEPMHIKFHGNVKLPVTEDVSRRIICLPSWYRVDREKVVNIVKETLGL